MLNKEDITISIVIPAYNIADYLPRCLDSVLAQTYENLQVIAVSDGSTDNTNDIILSYAEKDSRIVPVLKENGGVSSARLAGLEKATGDFIGFVDGDDFVEPDMFEHLLDNAIKYNADISHCGYKMVFPDGHEDLYYGTGRLVEQSHIQGITDFLRGDYIEPGLWNKIYKKEVVDDFFESPIWDSSIKINEDVLMNYLLFKKAKKSVYEDIPFYHYILRKGSAATSKKSKNKIVDPLKVKRLIRSDAKENPDIYNVAYCSYIAALVNVVEQNIFKEESDNAVKELRAELKSQDFKNCKMSSKRKMMTMGAAYFRPMYRLVRNIYGNISGTSRKYSLD